MTKVKSANVLLFALEYGAGSVKDKLIFSGHKPYYKGGERIEDLKEDLDNFPEAQVIIMETGAPLPSSYDGIAEVQKAAPNLPIILCTWDTGFWTDFCEQNDKPHHVASFHAENFDNVIAAALAESVS